jgi:lysophospholipase L1-like esterase
VCGEQSETTAGRAPGELASDRPGYLCLLIGANDAIHGNDQNAVGENIRSIIQAAKAQKTVSLVATLTPMYGEHAIFNGGADVISSVIRTVVKEEGAILVDLEKEFGTDQTLLQYDGLHPSDSGTQLIALSFYDKMPK